MISLLKPYCGGSFEMKVMLTLGSCVISQIYLRGTIGNTIHIMEMFFITFILKSFLCLYWQQTQIKNQVIISTS